MPAVSESKKYAERATAAPRVVTNSDADWSEAIGADLDRELSRPTPLQKVIEQEVDSGFPSNSGHMALSAIRNNLDRRAREWRGSAKVVEQMLRQLASAEQARAAALRELARIEQEVARTGSALTKALASFDETDGDKNIEPLFLQAEAALEELDSIASELQVAQHWCRSAWNAYSDALEREEVLRLHIRSGDV